MLFQEAMILIALKRLRGERTDASAYHLLTGKRSSQTITDAKWFQSKDLFGAVPALDKPHFESITASFYRRGWLEAGGVPGAEASAAISPWEKIVEEAGFDGWTYRDTGRQFWRRVALLIQTLSHLYQQKKQFVPIIQDVQAQQWVKRKLAAWGPEKYTVMNRLYEEMADCLHELKEVQAFILAYKLTGAETLGKTTEQIALLQDMEKDEIEYLFHGAVHTLIKKAENQPGTVLHECLDTGGNPQLTVTAEKTLDFINKGLSLDGIARARRLKKSTIEDHFVEIAGEIEEFSIDHLVPPDQQEAIRRVAASLDTFKLKALKEQLDDDATYFAIRLTLAKGGKKSERENRSAE
ncbi:helix-turn-helix domain-containing protein [Marinococcus halotolerans]|uniref:helix-turn-helix domain-containing protein n=1 Tax=Marinococcus halotolerans TaxID=301092 RepID=UPI0003B5A174|nr:helix-turn-helix domain-containing protein [Marinococcus halotolerans]